MRYDESLSHLLGTALHKYELTQATGGNYDSSSFSAGIRNHIPDNFVFKAFPIQINNKDPLKIFHNIKDSSIGAEILDSRGD